MEAIRKEDFHGIYPISCVESYILAYLRRCGFPAYLLYYQSYLSADHILHDFLRENSVFTQYDPVRRLQDIAVDLGVLELKGTYSLQIPAFENSDRENLIAIREEPFFDMYGKNAWRYDHYIYIKRLDDTEYYYLNNNPLHVKVINHEELVNIYNDRYITFRYIPENAVDQSKLISDFITRFNDETNFKFNIEKYDMESLEKVRDAIGILRIIRQRTYQFAEELGMSKFDWMKTANELYAQLEYMRIRHRYNPDILIKNLPILNQEEYEMHKVFAQYR